MSTDASPPSVAVILVNWNGQTDTLACLSSLREDRYLQKQIIVVDNGSTDGSVAAIREHFPEVIVLAVERNLGFTGGNNCGIAHAARLGVDYYYLLNNDTTSEPDAIIQLIAAARAHPTYGILTPVIFYFDEPGKVWFSGSIIDVARGLAFHDNQNTPEVSTKCLEIPWASGCAMLVPKLVMEILGGFDDRYFLNWEDVDLCLRVRQAGYKIGLVAAARIYHKVGRSFGRASGVGRYYHVRNNFLLIRTHAQRIAGSVWWRIVFDSFREEFRDWRKGRSHTCSMTFKAVWDDARKVYGPRRTSRQTNTRQ